MAIIGGGITGVSLLHHLGGDARLYEQDQLAAGASGRNAGFLLAGVADNYAAAVATYGRQTAREVWAFTTENHARLAAATAAFETGYRRNGSWILAADAAEGLRLAESGELLTEDGFEASWAADRLLVPGDGELDPVRTVRALAAGHLPSISERFRVSALEEIEADLVILATNAYSSRLIPDLPISPVRAQMAATAPDRGVDLVRPTYSDRGHRYWRQLPDKRVFAGGFRNLAAPSEVGFETATTALIQDRIDGHLRQLGVTAPVTHRWSGTMGFTPDGLPLVGAVPGRPGVYICGGYNGHGMGFAFNCARVLAEHLAGGPPPPPWLSPARFRPAASA